MGTHPIFESDFDCLTEKKMTLKIEIKTTGPAIVTLADEGLEIDENELKAKLTEKDCIVGNLEDLIELIKQGQIKKKKPNFVDTLPVDSDGEFILSEDDDDDEPTSESDS